MAIISSDAPEFYKLVSIILIYLKMPVYVGNGYKFFFRNTYIVLWHLYNYVMCMCLVTLLDFKLMSLIAPSSLNIMLELFFLALC